MSQNEGQNVLATIDQRLATLEGYLRRGEQLTVQAERVLDAVMPLAGRVLAAGRIVVNAIKSRGEEVAAFEVEIEGLHAAIQEGTSVSAAYKALRAQEQIKADE